MSFEGDHIYTGDEAGLEGGKDPENRKHILGKMKIWK